jgi:hypothetical protein
MMVANLYNYFLAQLIQQSYQSLLAKAAEFRTHDSRNFRLFQVLPTIKDVVL